jgi:hypothetical protein
MGLGLRGNVLQSVLVEYTVRMQLSDVYFIVIESPFRLDVHGDSFLLSPAEERDDDYRFAPTTNKEFSVLARERPLRKGIRSPLAGSKISGIRPRRKRRHPRSSLGRRLMDRGHELSGTIVF